MDPLLKKGIAFSFQLRFFCSNNQAKYEALTIGVEILLNIGVTMVEVEDDSPVMIKQLYGEYKCNSEALVRYHIKALRLMEGFTEITLKFIA